MTQRIIVNILDREFRPASGAKYEPHMPTEDELREHTIDVGQNYDNLLDLPVQRSDTDTSGASGGDTKPIELVFGPDSHVLVSFEVVC
jgi:hypothetical protein